MDPLFIDVVDITKDAMNADMARLKAISENISNISTPGYKRTMFANQLYALQAQHQTGKPANVGSPEPEHASSFSKIDFVTKLDTRAGALKQTGNPWDVAIVGDGFLEIKTDDGLFYTRDGSLKLDENGRIVDAHGNAVSGAGSKNFGSDSTPVIDAQGHILLQGQTVGQLRIVTPPPHSAPVRHSNGYLSFDGEVTDAKEYSIRQGHLEMSNVEPAREMVMLMETVRHLESQQKSYRAKDEMLGDAIRTLGSFS
ncbi:MAG: flagellar hook-basal body protein [Gammaproteobacteria bacterium]|nr:flagellar hook-basal body protein [Gammaproteobacteria bacterium]